MHFFKQIRDFFAENGCKDHRDPPSYLAIIQRALWNLTAKHFLQTKRLSTQLQSVFSIRFRVTTLILDRIRLPKTTSALQGDAGVIAAKLQDVASAGDTESRRKYTHITSDQEVSPTLGKIFVVSVFMQY